MDKLVYKYPLQQVTTIDVPPKSKVVRVGMDRSQPCIWIEHYWPVPEHLKMIRVFHLIMTGQPFNEDFEHVGSFAAHKGEFIGHVYEDKAFHDQGN